MTLRSWEPEPSFRADSPWGFVLRLPEISSGSAVAAPPAADASAEPDAGASSEAVAHASEDVSANPIDDTSAEPVADGFADAPVLIPTEPAAELPRGLRILRAVASDRFRPGGRSAGPSKLYRGLWAVSIALTCLSAAGLLLGRREGARSSGTAGRRPESRASASRHADREPGVPGPAASPPMRLAELPSTSQPVGVQPAVHQTLKPVQPGGAWFAGSIAEPDDTTETPDPSQPHDASRASSE